MLRAFLEPKALAVNAELCTSLCLPDVILAAETGPHQLAKACNYSLEGTTPTRCWSLRICLTGAGWGGLVIALFLWEQKNALIEGKQLLATSYCSQRHVEELDDMVFEVEPSESHYDERESVHKCPLCNTEIKSIRFVRPDATMAGLIQ